MQSKTVAEVLKLYNILSCGKVNEDKYKETLFFKSVTEDTGALIKILNGEAPENVMKINTATPKPPASTSTPGKPATNAPIDLSKKFGFFEGNRKVYELFGHALKRIVDTYGSETTFSEEDMFIQDGEEIKEKDYPTITTFFNVRTGTKYTKEQFTQEISARDIYLHFYAAQHKSFPAIIEEAQELSKVQPALITANGKVVSLEKEKGDLIQKIVNFKPELAQKYNAYVQAINNQQSALDKNQSIYFNELENAKKTYETACKKALENKTAADGRIKSEHKGKINAAKTEVDSCIDKLMKECGIDKK